MTAPAFGEPAELGLATVGRLLVDVLIAFAFGTAEENVDGFAGPWRNAGLAAERGPA